MPRKSRSYDKHVPLPDPKYGSVKYAKFINYIMERGKKNVARKIFYDALDIVGEKINAMPAAPSAAKPVAAKDEGTEKAKPVAKLDGLIIGQSYCCGPATNGIAEVRAGIFQGMLEQSSALHFDARLRQNGKFLIGLCIAVLIVHLKGIDR